MALQAKRNARSFHTENKRKRTVTHAPVVVSHTVSMEKFWARFNHLTEVLVLLIHFTMVT